MLLNISEIVNVTLMAPFVNLYTVFSLSSISGQFLLQGIKMLVHMTNYLDQSLLSIFGNSNYLQTVPKLITPICTWCCPSLCFPLLYQLKIEGDYTDSK